jgi:hypothetical protein
VSLREEVQGQRRIFLESMVGIKTDITESKSGAVEVAARLAASPVRAGCAAASCSSWFFTTSCEPALACMLFVDEMKKE